MPQWISDIISVAPWLGAIVLAVFLGAVGWKYLRPPTKGLNHFLEDWNGDADRPGVPGRPGVMVRFQNLEEWTAKYGPMIDRMDHEMHPNSGSSMADAVNRTERNLTEHIAACVALAPIPAQSTTNITVTAPPQQPGTGS